ncbi:hypothetical protein H8N03_11220 [Ramlibacter sp. USB13]|uniref:Uncharacterized protein n=1 Tax=Ramlibacter cellulosilyticus TaxID=2764187 RepID=A0A923MRA2_9BURK|nr:hypothetical protein [Ramlibacter cellulosilyticus]MBC5783516.1 hypothetical protein [Ramlibacter cellulosilyticus]
MSALAWTALGVALVLAGLLVLSRLRPARGGLTSPQWMLLLGALGMGGGLALDARSGGLQVLAALCSGPTDFAGMLALHLSQLPLAHVGMLAGGLLVVPLMPRVRRGCRRQLCARLGQNVVCSAWMVVGMAAGSLVFLELAGWVQAVRDAPAVLAGMAAGMVWGMVASVSLVQAWIRLSFGPAPHAGGST